jgi:hypothetical protein
VWWFTSVIPAAQEAEIGRIVFEASLGKKSERPISINKKLGVVVHTCHPSYAGSMRIWMAIQAHAGTKERPECVAKGTECVA